jgi:CubicO group peptidase (beta-lactamase class C family)
MKISLLLLLFTSLAALAEIPETVKLEVDQRIEHQLNPSIVVGVFENGQVEYYVKGLQNQALIQVATSQSVYEIGSITKTFTSLLLAQLIGEGKLQLDDPVQNFWPEPFKLVDSQQQPITFKQLATHTSGLPRLPNNLSPFAKDPYADYDRTQLLAAVKSGPASQSAIKYAYSNFAVGLLGESLAVIEQSTYNELITSKILQPLNLTQTYMTLDQVPESLLAQGYNGNSEASAWQFQALAGAGSIRSSIEDLLAYGVAHLEDSTHALKTAMQLATTVHYQQGPLKVGLGWHVTADGVLWHNGGTAGFRSIIMIDPVQQKVVAGITNSSNSVEDIAAHLMDPSQPMVDHEFPVAIESQQLDVFTGTFSHPANEQTIALIKQQDRLFFTAPKQPRQALTYIGDDTFKQITFKIKLKFNRDTNGQVTSLEFNGWGEPQTYQKIAID